MKERNFITLKDPTRIVTITEAPEPDKECQKIMKELGKSMVEHHKLLSRMKQGGVWILPPFFIQF